MHPRTLIAYLAFCLFTPSLAHAVSVGEKAPAFEMTGMDGKKTTINGIAGDVTVVNFWASWCGPCAVEFPALDTLAADYKKENLRVFAVSIDTTRTDADRFLAKAGKDGLHLTVLFDPESEALGLYGAKAIPTSYLIDRKGIIRYIHAGFRPDDPEKWRKEIDVLVKEKKK